MALYHITENGPMKCSARTGNCPFGGKHFRDEKLAYEEFESMNNAFEAPISKKESAGSKKTVEEYKEEIENLDKEWLAKTRDMLNDNSHMKLDKYLETLEIDEERFLAGLRFRENASMVQKLKNMSMLGDKGFGDPYKRTEMIKDYREAVTYKEKLLENLRNQGDSEARAFYMNKLSEKLPEDFYDSTISSVFTETAYRNNAEKYLEKTSNEVTGSMKQWIDDTLNSLPKNSGLSETGSGSILEIGSAAGRDAAYMESKGFNVQRTDFEPTFVENLRKQGFDAEVLDASKDPLPRTDAVFANAVLVHFDKNSSLEFMSKTHAALNDGGVFAFTLKTGEGMEVTSEKIGAPRFFQYWNKEDLKSTLMKAEFKEENIDIVEQDGWLHVIAKK